MNTTEEQDDLYYHIALSFVPGIGARTGRMLLDRYNTAHNIFKTPLKELKTVEGIGEIKAKGFISAEVLKRAETEYAYVRNHDIDVLRINYDNYPKRLLNCVDAPILLYKKGNGNLDSKKTVAIVGTRNNSEYGCKITEDLIEQLQSLEDIVVVSGLASGIDTIAHRKSVQTCIPTVGVLGHGHDRIYPSTNRALAAQMTEQGAVLSEFPSGTLPEKNNFPMRNRIVAGMSDVTVVVESHIKGGALITATIAAGYNREVAAFPGRVNDSKSAGCNELIRNNVAAMITKGEDLIELMNWDKEKKPKIVQPKLFITLTPDEQNIIDLLQKKETVHADEILHYSKLPNSTLAATLLQLEMQGIIKSLPGKQYRIH